MTTNGELLICAAIEAILKLMMADGLFNAKRQSSTEELIILSIKKIRI
jgi:hypothetical protein